MQIPSSLSDNLPFLITAVALDYRVMFDREMQPLGLTRSQWWVLTHIYYYGQLSQAKLAEILEVDKAGIARLVATLERNGWIERRADPNDRRCMQVSLTPDLTRLMADITALADVLIARSLTGLEDTQIAQIKAGLANMRTSLENMSDTPSDEVNLARARLRKRLDTINARRSAHTDRRGR